MVTKMYKDDRDCYLKNNDDDDDKINYYYYYYYQNFLKIISNLKIYNETDTNYDWQLSNKVFQKLFKSNFLSFALKAIKITTSCKCGGKLLDAWTPA